MRAARGRPRRPRVRGPRCGSWVSGSPSTTHTPALCSCPASVSRIGSRSSNSHRASPPRGLADCFASGSRRPPCIRCTTNVTGPISNSRCFPRDRMTSNLGARRHRGVGAERLQRGERQRLEPGQLDGRRTRPTGARPGRGPRATRASRHAIEDRAAGQLDATARRGGPAPPGHRRCGSRRAGTPAARSRRRSRSRFASSHGRRDRHVGGRVVATHEPASSVACHEAVARRRRRAHPPRAARSPPPSRDRRAIAATASSAARSHSGER